LEDVKFNFKTSGTWRNNAIILNIGGFASKIGLKCCSISFEGTYLYRVEYKKKIEDGISLLQKHLNRTIISIVSIWNSELVYDVVYEIQNEKKFERSDFTVVVQGFMDDIHDAFRNVNGKYDKSFYGSDVFHLSKYGNAVMGKFLWNNLLEPVGNKTTKADLGNDSEPLKCPTKVSATFGSKAVTKSTSHFRRHHTYKQLGTVPCRAILV
uniref:SGNH_hydro domain-containing protein n=1 Tax=Heligmosomoides polygyrus TaxID=6339 RepID=A0A8L8KIX3_HELPZ